MPKTPIDYSKCCIYKICCLDATIDDIYVGSTTDMVKRRWGHKSKCHDPNANGHHYNVYKFIRDNGGWDNWDMVRIESFPCENSEEMRQREREIFDELKPSLNTIRPRVGREEKLKLNREKVDAWQAANPEKKKATTIAWKAANPEKVKVIAKGWAAKKVVCEHCGKEVRQDYLTRHQTTKKCVAAQNAVNNTEPHAALPPVLST